MGLLKVFSLSAFLLLFESISYSQWITWQRSYGNNLSSEYGISIIQTENGGYLATTYGVLGMMHLNPLGDTVWTRSPTGYSLIKTRDNNYVFTTSEGGAVKIDTNGSIIWRRLDSTYGYHTIAIKQTPDGGYILCGSRDSGPYLTLPYLLKLDSIGRFQWERVFSNNINDGRFADVTISNEGDFVLCGNYSPGDTIYNYLFITKTDAMGNTVWFKGYSRPNGISECLIHSHDGGYIIGGGGAFLAKFDTAGTMQWSKKYDPDYPLLQTACFSVVATLDDGYALTGFRDSTGNSDVFIMLIKTDSSGTKQWHRLYGFSEGHEGYDLKQTADSGYIIIGSSSPGPNLLPYSNIYIVKTDKNGNTSPYIGISPISNEVPFAHMLYQNYPNPFNSLTAIRFSVSKQSLVAIKIYDALGREVGVLIDEFVKTGIYERKLEASNLPSGVYFYRMTVNGIHLETKKLMLLK